MEIPKFDFLWQYVEHWASIDPKFPAMRFQNKTYTSKDFNELSDKLAQAFLSFALEKGDRVVTILPCSPEFILTYMAASRIGAITVPMDVQYKIADLRKLIPHADPRIIVAINKFEQNNLAGTLKELSPEFGEMKYIIVGPSEIGTPFEEALKPKKNLSKELEQVKTSQTPEDDILIIFTGGTTGVPKAVLLSHKNVVSMCYEEYSKLASIIDPKGTAGRIRNLVNLPVSHVGGTIEFIGTGIVGGMEMLIQDHWSPYPVMQAIQKEKLPLMGGVPTMYKILLSLPDLKRYDLSSLKVAVLSGEKVSLELLQGIKSRICPTIVNAYGSTEAGAEVTFTEPSDDIQKLAEGYVGKPLPGVKIRIADEKGNQLSPGKVGEIIVRAPMTSKRYFKMPEEDKKGFTKDGFCKTGDLGYLDKQGGLYITGRMKEIIRVGSYTVLPAEIEEVVVKHPKVALAAAIGVPDEKYGEVVWLVVGPQLGEKVDEKELMELCKKELAEFKVPRRIIIYPLNPADLPITRIGKVDRVRLKKEILGPK